MSCAAKTGGHTCWWVRSLGLACENSVSGFPDLKMPPHKPVLRLLRPLYARRYSHQGWHGGDAGIWVHQQAAMAPHHVKADLGFAINPDALAWVTRGPPAALAP
jgi:hypothetical protein